jgi:hypothetical protein
MREQPHDWAEIYLCEYLETCKVFTLDLKPAEVKPVIRLEVAASSHKKTEV